MSAVNPEQLAEQFATALVGDAERPIVQRWMLVQTIANAVKEALHERRSEQFAIVANATGDPATIIGYYQSRKDAEILAADWSRHNGDVATYTVEPGEDW